MSAAVAPPPASEVSSEAAVLDVVERGRGDAAFTPLFLELLDERQAVYQGLDSASVTRIRGALLRALAQRALPDAALPFVLSELESAFDPWLTAVAAHALRRRPEPSPAFVGPLLDAFLYIRNRDDRVQLDAPGGYGGTGEPTSAVTEIFRALGWLGASGVAALPRLRQAEAELSADGPLAALREAMTAIETDARAVPDAEGEALVAVGKHLPAELADTRLQDQDGVEVSLLEFLSKQPTLVVFFFTRCGNPAKCPQTISRLGRLQARLIADGTALSTAALTYDPAYDTPLRLDRYGKSWGAHTEARHRFFRTLGDPAPLRAFFELGVSYGPSSVNQHQLEAFVLDRAGTIAHAVRRRRWSESEIISAAAQLESNG